MLDAIILLLGLAIVLVPPIVAIHHVSKVARRPS